MNITTNIHVDTDTEILLDGPFGETGASYTVEFGGALVVFIRSEEKAREIAEAFLKTADAIRSNLEAVKA